MQERIRIFDWVEGTINVKDNMEVKIICPN